LKVASNYVGNEEPIVLEDVPDSMFKLENPLKADPSKLLKGKILSLEEKCQSLMRHQHKSLYRRIKEIIGNSCYETNDTIYLLHSGLVLPFKRKHYPTCDNAQANLEKMVHRIFTDIKMLPKVMEKQQSLQETLYRIVMSGDNDCNSDDVKEIIL
jgi:hypothetical protein